MTATELQALNIDPDVPQFLHTADGKSYENRAYRGVQKVGGRECAVLYPYPNVGTLMPLAVPIENIVYICPMPLHAECERRCAELHDLKSQPAASAEHRSREALDWIQNNNPGYLKYKPL